MLNRIRILLNLLLELISYCIDPYVINSRAFVLRPVLSEYGHPCFLVISICMEYLFPFSHFQSVCVFCPKVVSCSQPVESLCFISNQLSYFFFIGAGSLLTFKLLISINYFHFIPWLPIFCSFSLCTSSFCFSHCGLMIFFCSMLEFLSFCFFVLSVVGFWFVVTMEFIYVDP